MLSSPGAPASVRRVEHVAIMIITCSPKRTLTGAPAELSITR